MASELEKQMAELMAGVSSIEEGAKDAQKSGARARRKSREIDDVLSSIDMSAHKQFTGLMGGRQRRKSKEFGDEVLKSAFDEFDTDKSGKLNREELMQVPPELED